MMFQSAAGGRTTKSLICDELTLDQLLADAIVHQLMRRDRVDEPGVRSLVRRVAAARSALRIVSYLGTGDENATAGLLHETVELWYRSGEVTSSERRRASTLRNSSGLAPRVAAGAAS
jgi:hypothetical protein